MNTSAFYQASDETLDGQEDWQEYASRHPSEVDAQRAAIRAAVACGCLQVNVMPTGYGYIEAVCSWHDRNAYILLCKRTRRILRYTEVPKPPLCLSTESA